VAELLSTSPSACRSTCLSVGAPQWSAPCGMSWVATLTSSLAPYWSVGWASQGSQRQNVRMAMVRCCAPWYQPERIASCHS